MTARIRDDTALELVEQPELVSERDGAPPLGRRQLPGEAAVHEAVRRFPGAHHLLALERVRGAPDPPPRHPPPGVARQLRVEQPKPVRSSLPCTAPGDRSRSIGPRSIVAVSNQSPRGRALPGRRG